MMELKSKGVTFAFYWKDFFFSSDTIIIKMTHLKNKKIIDFRKVWRRIAMSYPTWGYASGFVIEYINTNIKSKKKNKRKSKKANLPEIETIRNEKKIALYAEKAKASAKERDIRARERKKTFEENNLRCLKISTGIPQSKETISKCVSAGDRVILRDEVGDLYSAPVVGKDSPFLGKAVGEKKAGDNRGPGNGN